MTGPQLATLATVGWVIVTLAVLFVFGTWSVGGSWSILPGLVRGVRDWAAEHALARDPSSPGAWSAALAISQPPRHLGTRADVSAAPPVSAAQPASAASLDLPSDSIYERAEIEDLGEWHLL